MLPKGSKEILIQYEKMKTHIPWRAIKLYNYDTMKAGIILANRNMNK
jgi:hypothetical protein